MLQFFGPEGSEKEVVKRYADLQQWFAPLKLFPIGVTLTPRESWSVKLHNGLTVELGRDLPNDTVKSRIDKLITVYPTLHGSLGDKLEYVDLRYPNGLAIRATGLNLKPEKKKS
jgi:cell division protein FtsQ